MKKILCLISVTICLLWTIVVCPQTVTAGPKKIVKPIELHFGISMGRLKTPPANAWAWFGKELEKRSGGKVRVPLYPGQSLFKANDAYPSIVDGVADLANVSIATNIKRFPLTGVSLLPSLTFPDTLEGAKDAEEAFKTLYKEFPEVRAEFSALKLLWINPYNAYALHGNKMIRTPKDLKGLKVGCSGAIADLINESGGTSVNIPVRDGYMALKTGVVDSQIFTWSFAYAYKEWEVSKYHLDYSFGRGAVAVIMNKKSWNALPDDIKKLIIELTPDVERMGIEGQVPNVKLGKEAVVKHGNTIITPTSQELALWEKTAQPIEAKWVADRKKEGHGNAKKILDRYKQLVKESWK